MSHGMSHDHVIADLRREREGILLANASYADTERRHREQLEGAQQAISRGNARILDIDRAIAALECYQQPVSTGGIAHNDRPLRRDEVLGGYRCEWLDQVYDSWPDSTQAAAARLRCACPFCRGRRFADVTDPR